MCLRLGISRTVSCVAALSPSYLRGTFPVGAHFLRCLRQGHRVEHRTHPRFALPPRLLMHPGLGVCTFTSVKHTLPHMGSAGNEDRA